MFTNRYHWIWKCVIGTDNGWLVWCRSNSRMFGEMRNRNYVKTPGGWCLRDGVWFWRRGTGLKWMKKCSQSLSESGGDVGVAQASWFWKCKGSIVLPKLIRCAYRHYWLRGREIERKDSLDMVPSTQNLMILLVSVVRD